jgi:hypothetical protein
MLCNLYLRSAFNWTLDNNDNQSFQSFYLDDQRGFFERIFEQFKNISAA